MQVEVQAGYKGGSLWVHKSTHHFDLINWWLGEDPVDVSAFGALRRYGKPTMVPSRTTRRPSVSHFRWRMAWPSSRFLCLRIVTSSS